KRVTRVGAARAARGALVSLITGIVLLVVAGVASAATWTQRAPSGTPPPPGYAQTTAAYDAANDRLVFFSIDDGGGLPRPTDTWVLAGATGIAPSWIKPTTT